MAHQFSLFELRERFVRGDLSAVQICTTFLERINTLDPQLGAFLTLLPEQARKQAEILDLKRSRKEPLGPLAAVPVALKDNINYAGSVMTCGSRFLANYTSVFDATVARLIQEAGGIIIGKTNLDEFAMGSSTENSAFHPTKNPWDVRYSPGGSSGGSAAAVAARLCPVALGSDTGGSIRQPAAFSGVVGFKPSYGRISRYGLVAFGSSLDQIGPMTRSVAEAALVYDVLAHHCPYDATSLPSPQKPVFDTLYHASPPLTIGVPWKLLDKLDQEPKAHFVQAIQRLEGAGHAIVEVNLDILKYSVAVYYILATAEASTNLARFDGVRYGQRSKQAHSVEEVYDLSRQEGFGPEVKRRIMLGTYVLSAGYQEAYYKQAQKVRSLMIQTYAEAFRDCDVIATPTSPSAALKLGEIQDPLKMYLQDIFTIPANLAGLPGISIPSGFSAEGLPFGFHLSAPWMHDAVVLQAAAACETILYPPRCGESPL